MAFDKRKALQNALTYTQQGKWDKAITEYQAILKADPRDLTVCNNLGDLYARAGKTAEAIDQYLKLGELYRADGLSVKAIAVYKKIAKLDPNRTAAYTACADLYLEQGLVGEAKVQLATVAEHYAKAGDTAKVVETYQHLAQLDPGNYVLVKKLGDLMLKEGMRDAAAAEYERAAQAAQTAGQEAESRRLLQKARELQPPSPESNLGLGEMLLREGKAAEAIEALQQVTGADTDNASAWRMLGEAYGLQGASDKAASALQRAVSLGVPESEIAGPLAVSLFRIGRGDEALALSRRTTAEQLAQNDPDAAVAFLRDLAAAAPQQASLHADLATVLLSLGREEEAHAALWDQAKAQEEAGEAEEALQVYRQIAERFPEDAEVRARLESLQGPKEEAEIIPLEPLAEEAEQAPVFQLDEEPVQLKTKPAPPPGEEPFFQLDAEEDDGIGEPQAILLSPEGEEPASLLESPKDAAQDLGWLTDEEAPTVEAEGGLDLLTFPEGDRRGERSGLTDPHQLAGMQFPMDEPAGGALPLPAEFAGPPVEAEAENPLLGSPELADEEEPPGHIAEKLAEAEVYLKYGLEEKARERLLEVKRSAPENLGARRRLKAIYRDRHQDAEACAEILAIARILGRRNRREAALREVREGLELAPNYRELRELLVDLESGAGSASTATLPTSRSATIELRALKEAAAPPSAKTPEDSGTLEGVPLEWALEPAQGADAGSPGAAPSAPEPSLLEGGPQGEAVVAPDEEGLPIELRSLLEEPEESPILMVEGEGVGLEQAMADDLSEAEFYLSQGMADEAREVYRRMQARDSRHSAVVKLAGKLAPGTSAPPAEGPRTPPAAESAPPPSPDAKTFAGRPGVTGPLAGRGAPAGPQPRSVDSDASMEKVVPKFTVADSRGEGGGFVNLGAQLEEELAAEEHEAAPRTGGPLVDGLLREFQKGVREQLDEKDFETHYNLGIAYKEMELFDEAIQEFRLAARDAKRALECADLLGICFLAKGQAGQAVQELIAGLKIEGQPRGAYHSLRYDLGLAYESQGDMERALAQFETVQREDPRFKDVQVRVQALQARVPRRRPTPPASVPPPPAATPRPPKTEGPRPAERKKKISFI